MGNLSENFDPEELISYGDDLINVLKDNKGLGLLAQSLEHLKVVQSSCDADFIEIQKSIKDCQKKIDDCKKKTEEANSGIAAEAEIERLHKELELEMEREQTLKEELRVITDEMNDLNDQRDLIEEQRLSLKRKEQDDLRAEKKLSMHASVTKVIPNFDDPSKISGYIVDRDKKVIEKFEFDPTKMTAYETCNSIWNVISK